jgi:hypothetical protein
MEKAMSKGLSAVIEATIWISLAIPVVIAILD